MKVYELSYVVKYGYGSGIALVAANSPEEALKVANEDYKQFEDPTLVPSLRSDWLKPGVIIEETYEE